MCFCSQVFFFKGYPGPDHHHSAQRKVDVFSNETMNVFCFQVNVSAA